MAGEHSNAHRREPTSHIIIVNGFIHSGITGALDGKETADLIVPECDQELDFDDCFDESDEADDDDD